MWWWKWLGSWGWWRVLCARLRKSLSWATRRTTTSRRRWIYAVGFLCKWNFCCIYLVWICCIMRGIKWMIGMWMVLCWCWWVCFRAVVERLIIAWARVSGWGIWYCLIGSMEEGCECCWGKNYKLVCCMSNKWCYGVVVDVVNWNYWARWAGISRCRKCRRLRWGEFTGWLCGRV